MWRADAALAWGPGATLAEDQLTYLGQETGYAMTIMVLMASCQQKHKTGLSRPLPCWQQDRANELVVGDDVFLDLPSPFGGSCATQQCHNVAFLDLPRGGSRSTSCWFFLYIVWFLISIFLQLRRLCCFYVVVFLSICHHCCLCCA